MKNSTLRQLTVFETVGPHLHFTHAAEAGKKDEGCREISRRLAATDITRYNVAPGESERQPWAMRLSIGFEAVW